MLLLQQAVFLRGVNDPADPGRITTTLYRPKHKDLRFEQGFVRSGDVLVPLDNVVELRSIKPDTTPDEAPVEGEEVVEAAPETVVEEAPRRRGRPRKNPVG